MRSRPRVLWDSCVIIDYLAHRDDHYGALQEWMDRSERDEHQVVVCSLALCEVARLDKADKTTETIQAEESTIRAFFRQPHVVIRQLDGTVGESARGLVQRYHVTGPDAAHVAAALLTPGVSAVFTTDHKLLRLDGQIDGLRITPPEWPDRQAVLAFSDQ